jgi:hypothetical protein
MSELIEAAIQTALLTKLKAFATANSLRIAYPGVAFEPPKTTATVMWLRVNFIPADTITMALTYGAPNQHYGLMQVDVMLNAGSGERPALRMAASLIAYFPRGTKMNSSGFTVEVTRAPFRNSSQKDDPWIFFPVRIPYNTFAT